jgi:hypothetical protein
VAQRSSHARTPFDKQVVVQVVLEATLQKQRSKQLINSLQTKPVHKVGAVCY